jgi:GT2 family glycosyltransferase
MPMMETLQLSVIVISFNTRDLLRECLQSLLAECAAVEGSLPAEVLVVDNASSDGSAEMVEREFLNIPGRATPVRLLRSKENLGFGRANNLAIEQARGAYIVLLNSDAFFQPGALERSWELMEQNPEVGIGGARQVGPDGSPQPSARMFHSLWRDATVYFGLASRFPRSRIFASLDRTWADLEQPADVDWVPGAFMIFRRALLEKVGVFDPRFFLYYEETDLCRRFKAHGFPVRYWPSIVVTHLGGQSGRSLNAMSKGKQRVELWRMRSMLLYYHKHHGGKAWLAMHLEHLLYQLRFWRNRGSRDPDRRTRGEDARILAGLVRQAWVDTSGGTISPAQPW